MLFPVAMLYSILVGIAVSVFAACGSGSGQAGSIPVRIRCPQAPAKRSIKPRRDAWHPAVFILLDGIY
jgi:hypothetical protein